MDIVREGRLVRLCCAGCTKKVDESPAKFIAAIDEAVIADQGPRYPLQTCIVSDEPLEEHTDVVHGTRLVRLCCKMCKREFANDSAAYMAQLDEAWIASQKPDYPLSKCPVSDEPLGSMGEPVDMLYGTRLVRLCCKGCKRGVAKNPRAVLATIEKARAEKKAPAEEKKQG